MTDGIRVAFVLGAGLGTRLRPLTNSRPKPLVPIFNKPLITFALDHLAATGVKSFVINTHHLPDQFEKTFPEASYAGRPVKLIHEPVLLETGGGIKNAESFLNEENFIVYSGDILTDLPLQPLIDAHVRNGNSVTLALRETGFAPGITCEQGRITDIRSRYGRPPTHDFANVSIWNREIFAKIASGQKISFVPVLSDWIGENGKVGGVVINEGSWFNIGSRREYLGVHQTIFETGWRPAHGAVPNWPNAISPLARMAHGVSITGYSCAGAGTEIGEGAVIENSILWEDVKIASRARLGECIICDGQHAGGNLDAADI